METIREALNRSQGNVTEVSIPAAALRCQTGQTIAQQPPAQSRQPRRRTRPQRQRQRQHQPQTLQAQLHREFGRELGELLFRQGLTLDQSRQRIAAREQQRKLDDERQAMERAGCARQVSGLAAAIYRKLGGRA